MYSATDNSLDDPSGTASTQPIAKPQSALQPMALAPDVPSSPAAPIAAPTAPPPDATSPVGGPPPIAPPPLATPDPLAFAPQTPTPALPGGSLSGGTLNPTPAIPAPASVPFPDATPAAAPATDPNGLPAPVIPSSSAAPSTLPAVPAPTQAPVPSAPSTPAPIPTDANGMPSYSTTPTTPDNSLLNSTITPGPATDRYAIAQKEYNDWVAQSDPQFQAQMRDANRYSAAAGRIGSGQATNSIGDIQTQRENATRSARDSFLGNALTGSIDDAYKNIGVAQQQQGFQAGQQQTAFGQNVQLQELANSEQGQQYAQMMQSLGFNAQQIQQAFTNAYNVQQLSNSQDAQSFYQALQQEIQGSQGDPAQILAWISGQYARGAAA